MTDGRRGASASDGDGLGRSGSPVAAALAARAFDALASCYRAVAEAAIGPEVAVGEVDGFVYGGLGTQVPDINRIMGRTSDHVPSPATVERLLAAMAPYRAISWWIPPGPAAAALEGQLRHEGFDADDEDGGAPGMLVALSGLGPERLPTGVTIEVAASSEVVAEAARVTLAGFGMPAEWLPDLERFSRRYGERPDGNARYFLARLEGRPVATAIGAVAGDAVGIYSVATLPEARGRGIGRAVTLAPLLDGRARGARIGVLESSRMGASVYHRLGFRDAGTFRILSRSGPGSG